MSLNDENTHAVVRRGADRVDTFLAHFSRDDATWESFGKCDLYLELLRQDLLSMLQGTEHELRRRVSVTVEPTDYGT